MNSSITCPPTSQNENQIVALLAVDWPLAALGVLCVALRIYSRALLTRSFGSDDVTIIIALGLVINGTVCDTLAGNAGFGRHCSLLTSEQLNQAIKWIYLAWLNSFLCLFFIRASVMLFTLRLLPRTKKRSGWIIGGAFTLNIVITLIATLSFGLQRRPFSALWRATPGAKQAPEEFLVASNQVNGILACVIDITTACIPAFLIWGVQMKRKTKVVLDIIFALGLVTAALSIGRAATITRETISNDVTWRMVLPLHFSIFESKVGVCIACCPALRQLMAYYLRTKTFLPSRARQPPNADFSTMRHRINLRDWVWRGKRDPMRAQGLLNARKVSTEGSLSREHFGATHPEDSPLSELQHRIVQEISHV